MERVRRGENKERNERKKNNTCIECIRCHIDFDYSQDLAPFFTIPTQHYSFSFLLFMILYTSCWGRNFL